MAGHESSEQQRCNRSVQQGLHGLAKKKSISFFGTVCGDVQCVGRSFWCWCWLQYFASGGVQESLSTAEEVVNPSFDLVNDVTFLC